MIFLDPWIVLIGGLLALYGVEQLLVNLVRFIDRRSRRKPKPPPPPPSTIIIP